MVRVRVVVKLHSDLRILTHLQLVGVKVVVKLRSDLRILTQLQLVGVGVDFVFPLEGRRKERRTLT